MLLPSGEKTTEVTDLPCASCFSALSSNDVKGAAVGTGAPPSGFACGGFEKAQPIAPPSLCSARAMRDARAGSCVGVLERTGCAHPGNTGWAPSLPP